MCWKLEEASFFFSLLFDLYFLTGYVTIGLGLTSLTFYLYLKHMKNAKANIVMTDLVEDALKIFNLSILLNKKANEGLENKHVTVSTRQLDWSKL